MVKVGSDATVFNAHKITNCYQVSEAARTHTNSTGACCDAKVRTRPSTDLLKVYATDKMTGCNPSLRCSGPWAQVAELSV